MREVGIHLFPMKAHVPRSCNECPTIPPGLAPSHPTPTPQHEAKVGQAAPRQEIANALNELVRRVTCGEPASSVNVLLDSSRDLLRTVAAVSAPATPPPAALHSIT
jgi:hypothetical protein